MDGPRGTMVTEQGIGRAAHYLHAEREQDMSAEGKALALCGRVFLPAALCAPLGQPCALCSAVVDLGRQRL